MWYARRKNAAALYGATRNMVIQLATFVPLVDESAAPMGRDGGGAPLDSGTLKVLRHDMGRWAIVALELAFLKAEGLMDSEQGRDYLETQGLLKPGEWKAMVVGDRHSTVFFWIQMAGTRLHRAGLVTSTELGALCAAVTGMRAQANDIMSRCGPPTPQLLLVGLFSTHTPPPPH